MELNKVLIDTNVCIDAANRRKPFAAPALEILSRSESGEFTGLVAAHSFDTIFYFLAKKHSRKTAYKVLNGLRRTVQVADVTEHVIDAAIHLNWNDFEDAIHYESARFAGCQSIITRNKKDFIGSELPVLSPQEFLDHINSINSKKE